VILYRSICNTICSRIKNTIIADRYQNTGTTNKG